MAPMSLPLDLTPESRRHPTATACAASVCGGLRWLGAAVLLLGLALPPVLAGQEGTAAAPAGTVHIDCQLAGGPWQPCDLQVESIGERWKVLVGPRIYEFLHDGSGTVRMRQGPGGEGWREVQSTWTADAALCWDGLCARGDIPLD
ncbi:MAG: hypothetical protein ACKO5F_02710 [Synechococcus sp.]